jgi:Type IV secretory pathway, VirB3-like protein
MPELIQSEPTRHRVFKAVNKPLLWLGVERRQAFFFLTVAAASLNLFESLLCSLVLLGFLWVFAWRMSAKDPQQPRILVKASKLKPIYDAGKRAPFTLERIKTYENR